MKSLAQEVLDLFGEKWSDMFKSRLPGGGIYDVFENPSRIELKKLFDGSNYHSVRFIGDQESRKMYVWKAESEEHSRVRSKLGLSDKKLLIGIVKKIGSSLRLTDSYGHNFKEKPKRKVWDWLHSYFPNLKF